ncbi:MAG: monovalent cation/H+ antiporter subunit D family protein [Syntrophales bacterium]|nr:monovalent cation/H+ antiporter subunit D family protein [Syntrophales bacterium]
MPGYITLLPLTAIFLPFVGAALIILTGERKPNLRESWTIVTSFGTFIAITSLIPYVLNGQTVECHIVEIYRGLHLKLKVDAFGLIFALLSSALWFIVSLYTIGYMRSLKEHNQTRFFAAFSIAMGGAIGVALSADLLTQYMFYEILTVSTYPLVAHKESPEARRAGRKYLAYLMGGAVFILFAMAMLYTCEGSLDFHPGGMIEQEGRGQLYRITFLSFLLGFGTKAAIMPLHEWLPSAMIAPTPVSALLHAVAVVKAGVFCVLRVLLYIYGPESLKTLELSFALALIVSLTIIGANVIAITQDNLKQRLAFSTINNLSIIILGALLLNPVSTLGAMLHLVSHGFLKITLFMCAGAIFVQEGKEMVSQMGGIGKKMPYTMAAFTVGALGLIGIPPIIGFLSKWFLCLGAIEVQRTGFLLIFLTSALLDAVYFLPIIYHAFFQRSVEGANINQEAPFLLLLPLMGTAIFSIVFFFFPNFLFHFQELADGASKSIFEGWRK